MHIFIKSFRCHSLFQVNARDKSEWECTCSRPSCARRLRTPFWDESPLRRAKILVVCAIRLCGCFLQMYKVGFSRWHHAVCLGLLKTRLEKRGLPPFRTLLPHFGGVFCARLIATLLDSGTSTLHINGCTCVLALVLCRL